MIHANSLGNTNKFLILGCGFSGSFFAKTIRQLGCTALTSSRSKNKDPDSFVFNSENGMVPNEKVFNGVTHILSCIPPDTNGNDPVLKTLKNKLKAYHLNGLDIYRPQEYMETPKVIGFLRLINLTLFKRSHKRLKCEKEWIKSGLPVQIFRLPGIYGPGRSTLKQLEIKNSSYFKKDQVFSRIHVADITNAIIYLLENKNYLKFHQIINIADDQPCSQIEVIQYCYDLLDLKCQFQYHLMMQKRNYRLSLNLFGWKIGEFLINFYAKHLDIN